MYKNTYKLVIVGGGSTWTPGLLKSLCLKKNLLSLYEIVLYDIDENRQEKVGRFASVLLKEEYPGLRLICTSDKQKAYENVDLVFCQIRTGGMKMREQDEKIPLKHGCIGQETCGAGGLAYAMRSIPDMLEIIKDIREFSPKAWILNYTNPTAILSIAIQKKYPDDYRILNICDQPINMLKSYAKVVGADYRSLTPVYFGLNHFGWFTHIYDRDKIDLLPRIKKHILQHGFEPENKADRDPSWLMTYSMVKDIITLFPEYLPNTYLQYYLFPEYKVSQMNKNYTRANEVMDGREKKVFAECIRVAETGSAKGSFLAVNDTHAELIVNLAIAIMGNTKEQFVMIVQNNGCIPNLSDDAMVEINTIVGKRGAVAIPVGKISSFYKGMIEQQYAFENLVCQAFFERSSDKLVQALTLNRTVVDGFKAKAILDDLMEANQGFWPLLK